MPPRRRPTALGPVPVPKGSALSAADSVEIDEERTTVDGGIDDSGWEEQTVAEAATPRRTPPRGLKRRTAHVSDDMVTVDTSAEEAEDDDDDEMTIKARSDELVRLADGTGESTVDEGTLDEMTVEEQARPLPPLGPGPAPQRRGDPVDCRFIIESGNDAGRTLMLAGGKISVGRGVDNDLVLTDIAVSRRHFEVSFDDGRYTLRDLGSGNGTLINDRVEDGVCHLRHGDRIEIGNTIIRVDHPSTKDDMPRIGWGGQDDDDEPSTIAAQPRAKSAKAGPASMPPMRKKRPTLPPPVPSKLVLPPKPPGGTVDAASAPAAVVSTPDFAVPVAQSSSDSSFPVAANLVAMPGAYSGSMRLGTQIRPNDKKVLIGVVGVTVAIVMAAIGVAVVRGGDDGQPTTAAAGPATKPSTTKPTKTAPSKAVKSAVPTPTPTAAKEPKTSPRIAMATPKTKTAASDLPMTTWGTSEQPLAAKFSKLPKRKVPAATKKPAPAGDVTPKPAAKSKPVVKPTPKRKPKAKPKTTPKRRAVHGPGHKRVVARRKRVATATKRTTARVSSAQKRALAAYKRRKFSEGANLLRTAAKSATAKTAAKLRARAGNYERVSSELTRAKSNESGNAVVAMGAYRRALAIDRSASGGAHATYIRIKLGSVAPKAAAAYMVRKRYEAAKRACDAAVNYGAGSHPTVRRVRSALSRKAAAFYNAAAKSYKGNPGYAKKLLRRAIAMVPADDPSYAKSYRLLNKRTKRSRDDDE